MADARDTPAKPRYPTPPRDRLQAWLDANFIGDWYYILPMATFLVLLFVMSFDEDVPGLRLAGRVGQLVIVGGLLVWTWKRLTAKERVWSHLPLGVAVGVLGLVQWVGTDKLLRLGGDWLGWTYFGPVDPLTADDYVAFPERWGGLVLLVLAIRLLVSVVVVPVMEEIFWRDFLWRSLISPNDLHDADVGEYEPVAFFGTAVAFSFVHPQWLVSIGYGLLMSWLIWRTRSLGSVIVAHAVTNGLLWAYCLVAWYGFGVDEWYFW